MLKKVSFLIVMGLLLIPMIEEASANSPPEKPVIRGSHFGTNGKEMVFYVRTVDPDGDKFSVVIDRWGDGQGKYCTIDLYPSGTWADISHTYERRGLYLMRIGTVDENGNVGTYRFFLVLIL